MDDLGSVLKVVNSSGNVKNSYYYDPYGNPLNKNETVTNPWQYAGGYYDANTGLYKFGTRYYDPQTGRWTQKDPQGGSYIYANNNPVSLTDNSGYCAGQSTTVVNSDGSYGAYLNECQTQQLQGALWVAAGVTAIAALLSAALSGGTAIPLELAFGLAAGLSTIAAGIIQFVDGSGSNQGIILYYFGTTLTGIGHQ